MIKEKHPVVVILGPTAVGKSEWAVELAKKLSAEIISADSRLFYRGMDIGTAKPSIDERAGIKHYLIDIADPDETYSLAQFKSSARTAIVDIRRRGKLPFLVGGTGQYIRGVVENWTIPEVMPDQILRRVLEDWSQVIGTDGLHNRLACIDPQAAERIDYRNLRRTVRALEVIFHTGLRFSEQARKGPSPYKVFNIGLTRPRSELYARIDARIDEMIAAGFVYEVQNLLDKGYTPTLPSFSAIGYREIAAYLYGEISLEEAVRVIRRRSRIYVRRQANWFKPDDPAIHWFDLQNSDMDAIEVRISDWLDNILVGV
jgi:tRNA dimethylallyltransferase